MRLYSLDPTRDGRWDDLVSAHPRASAFHQKGWLETLARTYNYKPIVVTSTPPGLRLSNRIVFCEVESWITGKRLVSLPFSDHVEPLIDEAEAFAELPVWFRSERKKNGWQYIELRPLSGRLSDGHELEPSE